MSQTELTSLKAMLAVIRAVAAHEDTARILFSKYLNLQHFLGLVSSSIDRSLKTDLLLTLVTCIKSEETALELWENLEASQIITTMRSTSAITTITCDIKNEIDQAKSDEQYALTQAVLELLHTLFTTTMPRNLGDGFRKRGVKPYFNFIVDVIFLKYDRYGIKRFC